MNLNERKIPFKIEFQRLLDILADQIYHSPFALLRENTQNAFDAIRMRQALEHKFEPLIRVTLNDFEVVVTDNGIGMTTEEIEAHFWYAGKSGKNTDAARAAGVVGTFGIGAMANFGVANSLSVESESAVENVRTLSAVEKSELSTDKESISLNQIEPKGKPGTTVRANLVPEIKFTVHEAKQFLLEFVEFTDIPVLLNDEQLSGRKHRDFLPSELFAWKKNLKDQPLTGMLSGDLEILGMATGELRVVYENIQSKIELGKPGTIILIQDKNGIRTMRSGFGLAIVGASSIYNWGGIVDLPFLKPTAGRETLDDSSLRSVHEIISTLDNLISPIAAEHKESFNNDGFLRWVVNNNKFILCGEMEITPHPGNKSETLASTINRSGVRYYDGRDDSIIQTYASEDEPLVVLPRRAPRRECVLGYLKIQNIESVDTSPRVKKEFPLSSLSLAHSALTTRIMNILEDDYFILTDIKFGSLSSGLPILVISNESPVIIYLDPAASAIAPLLSLYRDNFNAFGPFVKDFIRSTVFPRISNLVPSSKREGSEAFLRHLRSNREWFEYELHDRANLEDILEELRSGRLTVEEAKNRLTPNDQSFVELSNTATAPLSSIVDEFGNNIDDTELPDSFGAMPSIDRRKIETSALILTGDNPINGYRCFLSLSNRVQREKGHFFLQPHTTEVVWGGRKVIFIFQHHAREFGLYYDIICPRLIGEVTGGGPKASSTILTKTHTFIPIPIEIMDSFLPKPGERIKLEIRCDILYLADE